MRMTRDGCISLNSRLPQVLRASRVEGSCILWEGERRRMTMKAAAATARRAYIPSARIPGSCQMEVRLSA